MGLRQKRRKDHRWLVAGGLLATAAALAVLEIVLGLMPPLEETKTYVGRAIPKAAGAKASAAALLEAKYEHFRRGGNLSPEQQEVFGGLVESSRDDQTSALAVAASGLLFKSSVESDPALREESIAIARELRDLLRSKPRAGWSEMKALVAKNPRLSAVFLTFMEHAEASAWASRIQQGSHYGNRTREARD